MTKEKLNILNAMGAIGVAIANLDSENRRRSRDCSNFDREQMESRIDKLIESYEMLEVALESI